MEKITIEYRALRYLKNLEIYKKEFKDRIDKNQEYISNPANKVTLQQKEKFEQLKEEYSQLELLYTAMDEICNEHALAFSFLIKFDSLIREKFPDVKEYLMPSQVTELKTMFEHIGALAELGSHIVNETKSNESKINN